MKISVIIPAFNEEEVIKDTIDAYLDFLKKTFKDFELIAVNDGSCDKTEKIIRSFKDVICISYQKNKGKGYAVKRGVLRATGDYIFFTDADLSYAPENILKALSVFKENAFSGVLGVRESLNRDYPLKRRVASKLFSAFVRVILPTDIPDTQCGFKAFDKKTGKQIFSMSQIFDFGFDFEVVYLCQSFGKRLARLPVSFVHRQKSHVNPVKDFLKALKSIAYIKRRKMNEF